MFYIGAFNLEVMNSKLNAVIDLGSAFTVELRHEIQVSREGNGGAEE